MVKEETDVEISGGQRASYPRRASWTKESIYRTEIWYFLFCVRDPVKNMISPKRHCNVLFWEFGKIC